MASPPANQNGHRRRQLRNRVLAEETHCALCEAPVDKTLTTLPNRHGPKCKGNCHGCIPHPKRAEVDEDIPRSRGGSPLARDNTRLMHRECNRWKSTMTLAEAQAKRANNHQTKTITNLINW